MKSLSQLTGKKIKDIAGYFSAEWGVDSLVFQLTQVEFEDGTHLWIEGEHDMPYVPPNYGAMREEWIRMYEGERGRQEQE